MEQEYVLNGTRITSLEAFWDHISGSVIPGAFWGRNLDAFNDILRGGFGTPDEGFTLRWTHSAVSREHLSYPETVRQLELRLTRCHPDNRDYVRQQLVEASCGRGPTVFDWLVQIIAEHGPGGSEAESNIRLVLD